MSFLGIILTSLGITKVNDSKWEKELINLYNDIENLQGAKTKEIYIPVEKNYKYGFVDSKGQEKIKCQYDRVSYFNQVEINNELYYIALAKKDNKFYIISKTNNNFIISGNLEKYLQTIDEHLEKTMTKSINKQEDYGKGYLQIFEFLFQVSTKGEKELTQQTIEKSNITNTSTLNEKSAKYYYNNTKGQPQADRAPPIRGAVLKKERTDRMAWNLDSDRPIYAQLLERIQRQIVSGRYRPGDKLPSVRELAAEASVNPNTMQKAFAELERSGLIITRRTSGRFVTEDTQMIAQIRTSLAKEEIHSFLARMKGLGFETQDIIRILSQEEIPSEAERSAQA